MRAFLFVVLGSIVASTGVARADQCEAVDADTATWAQKVVTRGAMVAQFCETCGDKLPAEATKVTAIATKKDHGSVSIAINGKVVDLAYTYVQTGKTTWSNVGMLVGCGATGVTAIMEKAAPAKPDATLKPIPELAVAEFGACAEYVHAINQLAHCDKFPKDAYKAMHDATEQVIDAIKSVPPASRKQMFEGCKAGRDAVVQASASMGCKLQ